MNDDRGFVDYLLELLDPMDGVTAKRMFGGYGIFRSGLMFALVGDSQLYFKVDDENRADFEKAGSQPFQYDKDGKVMTMSYYTAPGEAMDNSEGMLAWAENAFQPRCARTQRRSLSAGSDHKKLFETCERSAVAINY